MKKSIRLFLTGAVQTLFFEQYIKEQADKIGVKGFFIRREDGRAEIFIEADSVIVNEMVAICRSGSHPSQIRSIEEKQEKFQNFKDFKILKI